MGEDAKFDTRKQKSFDYTSEGAKQLITLSAAILTFSVTLTKDVVINPNNIQLTPLSKWMLVTAWIYYSISIIAGLATIYMLAGQLTRSENPEFQSHEPSIFNAPVNLWMKVQQISFYLGLIHIIIFGVKNLSLPIISFSEILAIAIPILAITGLILTIKKLFADKEKNVTADAEIKAFYDGKNITFLEKGNPLEANTELMLKVVGKTDKAV